MGVNVRERPKGSGVWWVFIEHKGRRKAKKVGSKKNAKKIAEDVRHQLAMKDLGILNKSDNTISFYNYSRYWLDNFMKPPMREIGTYNRYKGLLEEHIKPKIGGIPLVDITRKDIRDTLVGFFKKGASKSSVGLMLCVISGTLNHAVDDEIITANPASGVSKKLRLDPKSDKEEIQPFTQEQVTEILNIIASDSPIYYPAFLTAFRTGLRIGELGALKWPDINFTEQYINVRRSAKDQVVKNKTKTDASRRRVDMSDQLKNILQELLREHKKNLVRSGGKIRSFVFQKESKLLAQNTLRRVLSRALQKAGLEHRRFHDIRHTYASILLSNGTPIVYVKEQLGHKSIQMTVDIYGHLIPSSNRDAVNALDDDDVTGYKIIPGAVR